MYKTSQPNPSSFKLSGLTCIWAFCDSANTCPPHPCEKQTKMNSFLCLLSCYLYIHCCPDGSGATEVGEGSTTAGRQHLSGEGGKKEMSADPVSHAHAHTHIRKRRIRTLTSNIHRSRVTRSALPSSLLPEAGAWRNTLSSYMQGEIP